MWAAFCADEIIFPGRTQCHPKWSDNNNLQQQNKVPIYNYTIESSNLLFTIILSKALTINIPGGENVNFQVTVPEKINSIKRVNLCKFVVVESKFVV